MNSPAGRLDVVSEVLSMIGKGGAGRPARSEGYEGPPLVHGVPRTMIQLNGERTSPSAVQKFDGQPLYYVLDKEARDSGEVAIFTAEKDARSYTQAEISIDEPLEGSARSPQDAARAVTLGGYVHLHEHINYQGATWAFYPNWGRIPDFRRVYPTLWWSTNINERVSSIDVNVKADPPGTVAWVVLYRNINFGGDQLWTSDSYSYDDGGGGMRKNLVDIGWNDSASSLAYGY